MNTLPQLEAKIAELTARRSAAVHERAEVEAQLREVDPRDAGAILRAYASLAPQLEAATAAVDALTSELGLLRQELADRKAQAQRTALAVVGPQFEKAYKALWGKLQALEGDLTDFDRLASELRAAGGALPTWDLGGPAAMRKDLGALVRRILGRRELAAHMQAERQRQFRADCEKQDAYRRAEREQAARRQKAMEG